MNRQIHAMRGRVFYCVLTLATLLFVQGAAEAVSSVSVTIPDSSTSYNNWIKRNATTRFTVTVNNQYSSIDNLLIEGPPGESTFTLLDNITHISTSYAAMAVNKNYLGSMGTFWHNPDSLSIGLKSFYFDVTPTSPSGSGYYIDFGFYDDQLFSNPLIDNAWDWASFGIDGSPPTGSIQVNSNLQYTTSQTVTLNLSASDSHVGMTGAQMRFSNNGSSWSVWQSYSSSRSWTLTSGSGTKTVYVQYRDRFQNGPSAFSASDSIVYDPNAPTGSISIDSGAATTCSLTVSLNLSATDTGGSGLAQMRFSNNGSTWSSLESYSTTKSGWSLNSYGGNSNPGTKSVFVQFRDNAGNLSSSYSDTIQLLESPAITSHPSNRTVCAGLTATFSVGGSGSSPLSYQWQKNGGNIGGATSSSYTTPATVASDSGSLYRCRVTNSCNIVYSNSATLTVNIPPTITTQPWSQTVCEGQTATFSIGASGTAPLSYQWQKDGVNIPGATSSNYTTPPTVAGDNGSLFRCRVTNSCGNVTSNTATLTVEIAPSITTHPSDQAVLVGETATFSVAATGSAPLSYQWQENGGNIPGATSPSYTTPPATSTDDGDQFRCVVTNGCNTVTSNSTTLWVTDPMIQVLLPGASDIWTTGNSATVTWTSVGVSNVLIELSRDTGTTWEILIASTPASSGSWTWTSVTGPSSTECKVRISDVAGVAPEDEAPLSFFSIVVPPPPPPPGVTATAGDSSAMISWNLVSGATSYNIYYATAPGVTTATGTQIPGVSSPYTHTGLTNGTTYYYIVTAVNSGGESTGSLEVDATPDPNPPPPPPTGVTAIAGDGSITVSWNSVSGATSYNVYYATATGVTKATGAQIPGVSSPYTHTGLTNGTTYYYIVTAENSFGESAESSEVNATPGSPPPSPVPPNGNDICGCAPSYPGISGWQRLFGSLLPYLIIALLFIGNRRLQRRRS